MILKCYRIGTTELPLQHGTADKGTFKDSNVVLWPVTCQPLVPPTKMPSSQYMA